jgi:pentafunctional AROM polypeptide
MDRMNSVVHIASLQELEFPADAVVIADAALPASILAALPSPLLVEAGEALKRLASIELLAEQVLARRASRPLTLVAVGGGSIGDAVGFLASVLWRGVSLWQIPSTLLAMVDSAHGGKNAVNLAAAKNQLGTFHLPERTVIVDAFLDTLPQAQRREGFAEILKALMLADETAVRALTMEEVEELIARPFSLIARRLMPIVDRSIRIKLDVVEQDPLDSKGIRLVLNLGHSLGHALELTAGIPHGEAVAWGLAATLDLSADIGLPAEDAAHMHALLYPLLRPVHALPSRGALLDALARDKKHQGAALRSVLLQGIARPIVTETVSAAEWVEAFMRAHTAFLRAPVHAWLREAQHGIIEVEAGKSELNRALVIAAQRLGRTTIIGRSSADDVRCMVDGLRALGIPVKDTPRGYEVDPRSNIDLPRTAPRIVRCGEGGTTFRFLLALAATNVKETTLYAAPALLARPHDALVHALRKGGAQVEPFTDANGSGYKVRGWERMPVSFSVDASESSQFASAIALLAAGADAPFTLRLLGRVASASYFEMTLSMLETVGVEMLRNTSDLVAFNPASHPGEACTLAAPPDASASAVWKVAQYFDHTLRLPERESGHPDDAIDRLLDAIISGQKQDEIVLDCAQCPDLVPVLVIAALRSSKPVRITGVAHARAKESNRIDGLAASLAALHIVVEVTADGFVIPPRASLAMTHDTFDTRGDHRLVMAGLLISMLAGEVTLTDPWCVTKSYPSFWDDVRAAGWSVGM